MARRLDGKAAAEAIHEQLSAQLTRLRTQGVVLKLVVVLVGEDAASASYVRGKQRTAEKIGLAGEVIRLPEDVTQAQLLSIIDKLNADPEVDGILVQLPLPPHLQATEIIERISPAKDVDGFHPMNVGRTAIGMDAVWPCTPKGIVNMLHREGISIRGRHAVVVGRSNIVGKPMAALLLQEDATVTVCHSKTVDLASYTRQADILVVAVGRAHLIGRHHVKPGVVVVDVGMNRLDGRLVGDVHFDEVEPIADAITPVPGGVGPLTVATLMQNTVQLGLVRRGLKEAW
ncbi:bifunctional protein FolD [Alicyclobacillus contaminans]|uniref:bifunctional methylenetetrahydrofolate dehydrogenase/methenyltetrahydrofolate cyclohydrolase FolD n=1 Tax=Alicyclobacillus contaminans TaxID=392016 RepID=UPI00040D723D|nr:bifunctional methylenetetrahydrofolate dehydrogenase/methenyltetrahydrofolate cyclohydrolase FolD [Alicyclobacillus contaminans]GMA52406.1 bifunctional protein FolD [Alicyclobacillus contaminans]